VEEIYALGTVRAFEQFARYGDVDTSAAVLRMADGVLVAMTGGRHDPRGYDIRMELFGSRESIAVGLDAHTPLRSVEPGVPPPSEPGYRDFTVRFGHAYRAELAHFLELARGRAQNPCTGRDALEALRIAIAADRSRAEHRPVRVAEIR
jgi:myo-inositol 2-dehydrogenase/D-chiro-inositol 1-dehydrogenase